MMLPKDSFCVFQLKIPDPIPLVHQGESIFLTLFKLKLSRQVVKTMEMLKKVLNSYSVQPLDIEEVTPRLYRIWDVHQE